MPLQIRQRANLDKELLAAGRDPANLGVFWQSPLIVSEENKKPSRNGERLLTVIPPKAAGVCLSHNIGYDLSSLPARFFLDELNEQIAATRASPVGFVPELAYR